MVIVPATAGMVAGACSSVITTPIDTVKTRLQVMDNYGGGRSSVLKATKALLKEDGWWGFYRGFGPRFLNMSLWNYHDCYLLTDKKIIHTTQSEIICLKKLDEL